MGYGGSAWIFIATGLITAVAMSVVLRAERAGLSLIFVAGVVMALTSPPAPTRTNARLGSGAAPGALERVRLRAAATIDRTFADDAPLARALLIADQHDIPPEMRDRYAAAGLVHMLSISGLHVAVIAAAMELLFQVGRAPRPLALIGAFATTAIYVAIIGAPAPALRSAAMLGVSMISRLIQRPTSPWAAWALGGFVPLIVARTILDVGYQLSVLGMGALVAAGVVWRRHLAKRVKGWKATLSRELLTSLIACVVTAPLVAWVFGRISIIAPVSNLLAAPVIGLAQPMLFLALLLSPVPGVARFVAQAVHPLLFGFDWIAWRAAAVPGASIVVSASMPAAICAALAAAALVLACISRHPVRPAITSLALLSAMVFSPLLPIRGNRDLEVHFLDVGQGDAILLRTPDSRWVLFDAGPEWTGGNAGRSVIIPYLRRRGGSLDAFVLSHPHADHVGGAAAVFSAFAPRTYWDAAFAGGSRAYKASLIEARNDGVEWHRVHPGDSLSLGGAVITFLAPDSVWTVSLNDPNLASTIALVRYGAVRFLLVGDAEKAEEDWLVSRYGTELSADVLKVGHHGSSTSSSDAFLSAVHPDLAVISVGARNMYGHPSIDVLGALARAGVEVLRTDKAGTIVVRTDGSKLEIEEIGQRWDLARRSSQH